jgi:hypothetical protein
MLQIAFYDAERSQNVFDVCTFRIYEDGFSIAKYLNLSCVEFPTDFRARALNLKKEEVSRRMMD